MVLIDAGAEYMGYSGDISRTWPVNGTFSDAQREVYEAVLRVRDGTEHPIRCICVRVRVCVRVFDDDDDAHSQGGCSAAFFSSCSNFLLICTILMTSH